MGCPALIKLEAILSHLEMGHNWRVTFAAPNTINAVRAISSV